jgi:hypothetical protein
MKKKRNAYQRGGEKGHQGVERRNRDVDGLIWSISKSKNSKSDAKKSEKWRALSQVVLRCVET